VFWIGGGGAPIAHVWRRRRRRRRRRKKKFRGFNGLFFILSIKTNFS
jgi:hypothetical protein